MERQRTDLYKDAFDDLKNVSAKYDQQLDACTKDMEKILKQNEKKTNVSFVKGILWGLAIGAVGGMTVGLAQ
jgi:hypothetical protein